VLQTKPTYLEDRCLAHGGKFPSTQVPCLKPTTLTLTFQTHPNPTHPLAQYYITMMTSTISNFLIRNTSYRQVYYLHAMPIKVILILLWHLCYENYFHRIYFSEICFYGSILLHKDTKTQVLGPFFII
jgi:hypothetical protein